jgi:hypothetical protein
MVGGIHDRNLGSATPAKAINTASCITILRIVTCPVPRACEWQFYLSCTDKAELIDDDQP